MSSTLKLLSKVMTDPQAFIDAKRLGVSDKTFYTADELEVWKTVEQYFQKHANVPPLSNVLRAVPNFALVPTEGINTSEIVEQVQGERVEIGLRTTMQEAESLLLQGKHSDAITSMHKGAAAANVSVTMSKDISLSSHSQTLFHSYVEAKEGGLMRGIPWPWTPLNEATGGILGGTYSILYGRPKSTKTFRLLEVALAAQEAGKRVLIVSCEMTEEIILARLAAIKCELDYSHVKSGKLLQEDEERYFYYLAELSDLPYEQDIVITRLTDQRKGKTVTALRTKIDEHEPELVCLDAMYKMEDEDGKGDANPTTIRVISGDIQALAHATGIPHVGNNQATRKGERARLGVTSDVAFGDAFAQDCDILLRMDNNKELMRTIFLVQAARETTLEGFSVGNKMCDGMGPIEIPGFGPDWSLPKKYTQAGAEETSAAPSGPRFTSD